MDKHSTQTFSATLERPEGIGTWTFLPIPIDVKTIFGVSGQLKVRGTIDGEPFRSSALEMIKTSSSPKRPKRG